MITASRNLLHDQIHASLHRRIENGLENLTGEGRRFWWEIGFGQQSTPILAKTSASLVHKRRLLAGHGGVDGALLAGNPSLENDQGWDHELLDAGENVVEALAEFELFDESAVHLK